MSQYPQQPAQVPPERNSARPASNASGPAQPQAPQPGSPPPTIRPAAGPVPAAARTASAGTPTAQAQPEAPASGDSPATSGSAADSSPARRVRLTVSHVDPWSVMKLSFLLSIAIGIMIVVAAALVWTVLNQMEVFAKIQGLVADMDAEHIFGQMMEYLEFSRVLSVATVIAVVDIVLITALSTLGAFIYNFVAAMVGGVHLTLTDD